MRQKKFVFVTTATIVLVFALALWFTRDSGPAHAKGSNAPGPHGQDVEGIVSLNASVPDPALGDLVIDVPAEYDTIQDALLMLRGVRISHHIIVTIKVAPGVYNNYNTINVAHANGSQIEIIGNPSNPEECVINFGDCNGFEVDNGHVLGKLDGFTLVGNGSSEGRYKGIFASYNSLILCGDNMIVKNFYHGVMSATNSHIEANNIIAKDNLRCGIVATRSSSVLAIGANVHGNGYYGIHSVSSSFVLFRQGRAENNGAAATGQLPGAGIRCNWVGCVNAEYSVVKNNPVGMSAECNGTIWALNADVSANTEDFVPTPNTNGPTGGVICTVNGL